MALLETARKPPPEMRDFGGSFIDRGVDWLNIRISFITTPCFREVYDSRNRRPVDKDTVAGSGSLNLLCNNVTAQ